MLYLSKGIVSDGSVKQCLNITHGSQRLKLTDMEADLWLRGRFATASTNNECEAAALLHLQEIGLAESEPDENKVSEYRILTQCVCCPAKSQRLTFAFSKIEKHIYVWLNNAGVHLTVAELIYLIEKGIRPTNDLLYEENRQALIERIYTSANISDGVLENQMEHSHCRNYVVKGILNLLRKKIIVVL